MKANPVACEMHGYTRQEFIGLNPAVFMLPESHVLFRLSVSSSTIKSHVSNTLSKLGIASRLLP